MMRAVLPLRDGVGASCVVLPSQRGRWALLLDALAELFPEVGRAAWQARMARGDVLGADGVPLAPHAPCVPGAKVHYYRDVPHEPPIPFAEEVIFQDDWIVVADKPHFLPVTPGGRHLRETLLVRLRRRLGIDTLAPMHRLDRETAGLVLFSVQPATRNRYAAMFRERSVDKLYEAIAPWRETLALPRVHRSRLQEGASFMTMGEVPGEPNSETAVSLLARRGDRALYALQPLTGKRHQLRVHMAALGLPIEGDAIYPVLQPALAGDDPGAYARPLQLLARRAAFTDPVTGQARVFQSRRQLDF
jgi:tRNA pseudouridine32 synthase/23S rRNA pseudouridine746 synthase